MKPAETFGMKRAVAVAAFTAAMVFAACGVPPEEELPPKSTNCLRMKLEKDGFQTAAPARVSLFFSVETCAGDPVAGLTADRFTLFEDEQPVSRFESQQRIRPRGQDMRMYSVLLLDLSGSMLRSGDYPNLRVAADAFLDRVFEKDASMHRVAIYAFDGRQALTPVTDFTNDRGALKAGLDSLEVQECSVSADCAGFADRKTCAGWRCVDDSTNLYGAVIAGVSTVDAAVQSDTSVPHRQGALVVFTDGTDQAARVSPDAVREAVSTTSSRIYSVGLGAEIDRVALEEIGKDGFFSAASAEHLSDAFAKVADRLTSIAQRYYVLEYCSPKRSGLHTLRVETSLEREDEPALRGSLENDFDATGFESGCTLD